jgi:hypothetical protein
MSGSLLIFTMGNSCLGPRAEMPLMQVVVFTIRRLAEHGGLLRGTSAASSKWWLVGCLVCSFVPPSLVGIVTVHTDHCPPMCTSPTVLPTGSESESSLAILSDTIVCCRSREEGIKCFQRPQTPPDVRHARHVAAETRVRAREVRSLPCLYLWSVISPDVLNGALNGVPHFTLAYCRFSKCS